MRLTASVTSHSSVLMWISGDSGASYGAEIPVKSVRTQYNTVFSQCTQMDGTNSVGVRLCRRRHRERRTLDLARARLLVEALRIALLDDAEGRVDEDLDERQPRLLVQLARDRAVCAVRRDERGEGDAARVREELRDLACADAGAGGDVRSGVPHVRV